MFISLRKTFIYAMSGLLKLDGEQLSVRLTQRERERRRAHYGTVTRLSSLSLFRFLIFAAELLPHHQRPTQLERLPKGTRLSITNSKIIESNREIDNFLCCECHQHFNYQNRHSHREKSLWRIQTINMSRLESDATRYIFLFYLKAFSWMYNQNFKCIR